MPKDADRPAHAEDARNPDPVADRIQAAATGLAPLVARAEQVQRARATERRDAPRWTDVFTTQFTEFSNRPR